MPYFIMQFKKPKKHRAGTFIVDTGQIGEDYSNLHKAEMALARLMDETRIGGIFLRIDRNVLRNSVVYADLDASGGVVRFRKRDQYHFSSSITLDQFKVILARRELAKLKSKIKDNGEPS